MAASQKPREVTTMPHPPGDPSTSSECAAAQNEMAFAYAESPSGDRDDNLRKAIACHEAALRVCTEAEHPDEWAAAQNGLGAAYAELRSGDRGENLARAIACCEAALRVHTETAYPDEWAAAQN